jgi:hypothetical protein
MAARPERFPDKLRAGPVVPPSSFLFVWVGQKFREWSIVLHLWLLSRVQSLVSLGRWPAPSQYLNTDFSFNSQGRPGCSLHDLQSSDISEGLITFLLAPQTHLPSQASVPYAIFAFRSRRRIFPNVRPFWVPCTILTLHPWRPCPLHSAGMTRRVVCLREMANFFRNPLYICLAPFLRLSVAH